MDLLPCCNDYSQNGAAVFLLHIKTLRLIPLKPVLVFSFFPPLCVASRGMKTVKRKRCVSTVRRSSRWIQSQRETISDLQIWKLTKCEEWVALAGLNMFGEKCRAAEANLLGATTQAHATHGVKTTEKEHCFLCGHKRKIKIFKW